MIIQKFLTYFEFDLFGYLKKQTPPMPVSELRDALVKLNVEYAKREALAPSQGYRVIFEESPRFQAQLISMGGRRDKGTELSGLPQAERAYQCPFCTTDVKIHQVFQDQSMAIVSQSGQLLVVPKKHYAHWFKMPLETQLELLQHGMELRKKNSLAQKKPLELHCGSAGFQTVFHTHLRTNVY